VIHRRLVACFAVALAVGCAPVSTEPPDAPKAVGQVVEDAQFRLVIRIPSDIVRASESVLVTTELTYLGPEDSVVVGIVFTQPVYFGLEQVGGDLIADGPVTFMDCHQVTLDARVATGIPYVKPSGYSMDDPNADFWKSYLGEPLLRLPPGQWRVTANLHGTTNGRCAGPWHDLVASATFFVVP
jgi:hypothetical protein